MNNLEQLEALIRRNVSLAEARVDTRSLGQWKQALELVEAMGWQPIDTAPKDGTDFLGWDGSDQWVVFHSKHGLGWTTGTPRLSNLEITHWRPLPESP